MVIDARIAGDPIHYLSAPEDINMRIPDQLIKCVGFITHDTPDPRFIGTVFVVSVPSELRDGRGYLHLVTAKHVAEAIDPGPFAIAFNGGNGHPIFLRGGDDVKWFYHPTESDSVDVAVLPFATAGLPEYDIHYIQSASFVSEKSIKEYSIGLGDEVVAIGLFTSFYGLSKLTPLVRTGNIAMMPEDRIPLRGFGLAEAYLIEGRSIGGLSGSPVFVRNTVVVPGFKTANGKDASIHGLGSTLHFFGLMHGHWDVSGLKVMGSQSEAVNMGVAMVIPAKKVLETLFHPELVVMRRAQDMLRHQANAPTPDVAKADEEPNEFDRAAFEQALKKVSRKIE